MSRTRNFYPARTNQKIYFARLSLAAMDEALAADDFDARARAGAHREAAIWHLHRALAAFMQELSVFYKVQPPVETPEALTEALAARQNVSPEASWLLQQREDPSHWASELPRLYASCLQPIALPDLEVEAESAARIAIPLVAVDEQEALSSVDRQTLDHLVSGLTAFIRHARAELVEF